MARRTSAAKLAGNSLVGYLHETARCLVVVELFETVCQITNTTSALLAAARGVYLRMDFQRLHSLVFESVYQGLEILVEIVQEYVVGRCKHCYWLGQSSHWRGQRPQPLAGALAVECMHPLRHGEEAMQVWDTCPGRAVLEEVAVDTVAVQLEAVAVALHIHPAVVVLEVVRLVVHTHRTQVVLEAVAKGLALWPCVPGESLADASTLQYSAARSSRSKSTLCLRLAAGCRR